MIKGIDISHWQGNIDWKKIPKEIEFVIMKASEGTTLKDVKFNEYKKAAREKGLGVGYYHFARGTDAVKEADFFLKSVGEINEGEVLALDFEAETTKIKDPVGWCTTFVKRIQEKAGFLPFFYSYSSVIGGHDWKEVYNCGLWIADPSSAPRIGKWKFWAIWQYTVGPVGSVAGIPAKIDMDYFNGDIATFKKYGKPHVEEAAPQIDYQVKYEEEKKKNEALTKEKEQCAAEKTALIGKLDQVKNIVNS